MTNEIIIYQYNEQSVRLEVRIEEDTVWLTQAQMAELFQTTPQNITIHLRNIYQEGELNKEGTCKDYLHVQNEGARKVKRTIQLYNLDVIISAGYRVKSKRGTQFRIWANQVLKEYLLRGYAMNNRMSRIEDRVHSLMKKVDDIDLQIKTSLPPTQGIYFDGQIFDAWVFVSGLVKSANHSLVLIDNYVDESVLNLFLKRNASVSVRIYTAHITKTLQTDLEKHNKQYAPIEILSYTKAHDRFLIIDNQTVYHMGASLKDLGKKLFAFSKMNLNAQEILKTIQAI
ncbi:MAG: virulence RhuM family protein [Bacteroidales bacterium]|nr:virulence RhuM family protein [Bacteroidales bacterium]HOY37780.1 RhuM family protein [Bacteroidales bacterium]